MRFARSAFLRVWVTSKVSVSPESFIPSSEAPPNFQIPYKSPSFLPRLEVPSQPPHPIHVWRALWHRRRAKTTPEQLYSARKHGCQCCCRVSPCRVVFTRALYISEPLFLSFKHTSKHTHTPSMSGARSGTTAMHATSHRSGPRTQGVTEAAPVRRVSLTCPM